MGSSREGTAVPQLQAGEERRIVEACLKGDVQAFRRIVERYQNGIHGLCYRMTGNRADAEELAQEAFVRAFRALASFEQDKVFSTWLFRIAVNACRDHLRSRRRTEAPYGIDPGPVASEDPGPEAEVGRGEMRRGVERALQLLPEKYREILILRHYEGIPYEEIAQISGDTVGALKVRAVRARAALMERFRALEPELAQALEEEMGGGGSAPVGEPPAALAGPARGKAGG
jgi:RNA polymerase sigma-70 factor (ECF subfamily)